MTQSFLKLPCLAAILSVFLFLCSGALSADEGGQAPRQVVLEGVLGSKAVFSVDGKRVLLSSGQEHDGVKILSIQQNTASVEIGGKRRQLRIGDSSIVASPYKQRKSVTVTVSPDNRGMYTTVGSINSLPVTFLVDTGASSIAMNAHEARRLGIEFRYKGKPTMVATASGTARAYNITLDKVSVGQITLNSVPAVVVDGDFPLQVLLGMSFLGRLEIQREGAVMRIKQKY